MKDGLLGKYFPRLFYPSAGIFVVVLLKLAFSDSPSQLIALIFTPVAAYLLFGRWITLIMLGLFVPLFSWLYFYPIMETVGSPVGSFFDSMARSHLGGNGSISSMVRTDIFDLAESMGINRRLAILGFFGSVFYFHMRMLGILRGSAQRWIPAINLFLPLGSVAYAILHDTTTRLESVQIIFVAGLLIAVWLPGFRRFGRPSSFLSSLPLALHYLLLAAIVLTEGAIFPALVGFAIFSIAGYWFPAYRRLGEFWRPSRLPLLREAHHADEIKGSRS